MIFKKLVIAFIISLPIFYSLNLTAANKPVNNVRTEVYHMDQGINDYDKLFTLKQINEINTRLQLLTKQFPDGINIVVINDLKGYDSLENYIKDFLSVNKSEYKESGLVIFIFVHSKYVDMKGHETPAKSTYNYILPYKRNIFTDIKTGIDNNDIAKGITNSLDYIIQQFQIEIPKQEQHIQENTSTPEHSTITEQQDKEQQLTAKLGSLTISKSASIWQASVSIVLSLIIMFYKILSIKGDLKRSSIPVITQIGVDLLYFSLLISIFSAFYLFFLIKLNYIFLKIIKLLVILVLARFVISRIGHGRNWARYMVVLWVIVTMYIDIENNLYTYDILSIGAVSIYIVSWVTCILGLIFVYLPVSSRWMEKMKKKRLAGVKQPYYITKESIKKVERSANKQVIKNKTTKSTKNKQDTKSKSKDKKKTE